MTNALVPRAPAMAMGTLADPRELGNVLAASGYFSDAREAAQAVVKVLAGAELGFGPIASMTGVYIVKGRVTLSANLMAACVKRHPKYDYRVRDLTNDRAVVQFMERGTDGAWTDAGESEFTMDMARTAGLAGGENWKKYPRNMLLWRAMSNGAKFFCPDAFSGAPVYTPDELGADVDPETGEFVSETSVPVASTVTRPAAEQGPSIAEAAKAGAALQESPAPANAAPKPESVGTSERSTDAEPVEAGAPSRVAPANTDPGQKVSADEAAKLREYLDKIGAPPTFADMALMTYDVPDVESLTVGQAHEVMERAKARYGVKA